jgi:hypothetical protein
LSFRPIKKKVVYYLEEKKRKRGTKRGFFSPLLNIWLNAQVSLSVPLLSFFDAPSLLRLSYSVRLSLMLDSSVFPSHLPARRVTCLPQRDLHTAELGRYSSASEAPRWGSAYKLWLTVHTLRTEHGCSTLLHTISESYCNFVRCSGQSSWLQIQSFRIF